MTTFVFGANGAAGRALLQRLGNEAVAVLRTENADPFFAQRKVAFADAFDLEACKAVLMRDPPRYIISFLGGKTGDKRADNLGNINLIRACEAVCPSQFTRFILISSIGCGEQYAQMSEPFKQFLGEAVQAKTEAEEALKTSKLPWTILRPCGLNNENHTEFTLHEHYAQMPSRYLSRDALASAILHVMSEDYRGKVLSVTT